MFPASAQNACCKLQQQATGLSAGTQCLSLRVYYTSQIAQVPHGMYFFCTKALKCVSHRDLFELGR